MQRRRNKSKSKCQNMHAKRRAMERFGINLNIEQLVKEIQQQQLTFLERQSNIKTLWYKELEGIKVVVVYDSMRKQIATVMPYRYYLERGGEDVAKENNKENNSNRSQPTQSNRMDASYKELWLEGC